MIPPILALLIVTARLLLEFDPKPYPGSDVVKHSIAHTTSQALATRSSLPILPSNVCPWSLPIQRENTRPVTTLNDVARKIARFGPDYTDEPTPSSPTIHVNPSSPILLYNPSYTTSVHPIKIFTSSLSEAAVHDMVDTEFPSLYLLVKYLVYSVYSKFKVSHLCDALSIVTVLALSTAYFLLAKAFWGLHQGNDNIYGPVYITLTRRQRRRLENKYKRQQRHERAKHVEELQYFQSVINHGMTIVTDYKTRLVNETRQNAETTRELAIKSELEATLRKSISDLERMKNLQEQMYQRRIADIDALEFCVQDRSALVRAKERELNAQRDLINQLRAQIKETEMYYARRDMCVDQGDFDLKMEDARRIQQVLEASNAKKDAIIDGLKAQTTSMKADMDRMSAELVQTACNQAQTDTMKEEMDRMRMEIEQLRGDHKEEKQTVATLRAESLVLREKTLADTNKVDSEIRLLTSNQHAAEQTIVTLRAEIASLKETAQTDALKNQLEMDQMRDSYQAKEQTIATLLAESASLSDKSASDRQEITRLNGINAAQSAEITTMNAMLAEMCQFVNPSCPVSEGSTEVASIPTPCTSESTMTTAVEAGGASLGQLLSEVEASRSEIMETSPKEIHHEQLPFDTLAADTVPLPHTFTIPSLNQPQFSWDFADMLALPLDEPIPNPFDTPYQFPNQHQALPIENQVSNDTPPFLGSAEDIWSAAMALDSPEASTNNVNENGSLAADETMVEAHVPSSAAAGLEILSQASAEPRYDLAQASFHQQPSASTSVAPSVFNLIATSGQPPVVENTSPTATCSPNGTQFGHHPLNQITSNDLALGNTRSCDDEPAVRGLAAAAWAANPSGSRPLRKLKRNPCITAFSFITPSPTPVNGTIPQPVDAQIMNPQLVPTPVPDSSAVVGNGPENAGTSDMDIFRSTAKALGRKEPVVNKPPPAVSTDMPEDITTLVTPKKPAQPKPRGRSVLSATPGGKLSVTKRA